MPITVMPFDAGHIDQAAALATHRYRQLRSTVPPLPSRYGESDIVAPMLSQLRQETSGAVAMDGSRMAGFMLAMTIADFRGRQTVYSPEWANAAPLEQAATVYEQLLATLSAEWYAAGSTSFLAALFADSQAAAATFNRLGFGILAMDAMRDLTLPQGVAGADVRRATGDDLDALELLERGLCSHLQAAPVFLLHISPQDRASLAEELADERIRFFLAFEAGSPVAFMKIGPATQDASTIIRDDRTASITGAYTLPEARGRGLGAALLAHCMEWARSQGYVRCGVDFEPSNVEANRFWRRHFRPVCFGMQRLLNVP